MDFLVDDIILEILLRCDLKTLYNLSQTNTQINRIFGDILIWENLILIYDNRNDLIGICTCIMISLKILEYLIIKKNYISKNKNLKCN